MFEDKNASNMSSHLMSTCLSVGKNLYNSIPSYQGWTGVQGYSCKHREEDYSCWLSTE